MCSGSNTQRRMDVVCTTLAHVSLAPQAPAQPAARGHSRAETAILAATEQLLQERPLHQLSVSDIVNAAGVSRTSFYAYFASKTAVIAECLRQVMDQVMVAVRPLHSRAAGTAGAAGGDAETAIRVSLEQWVGVC